MKRENYLKEKELEVKCLGIQLSHLVLRLSLRPYRLFCHVLSPLPSLGIVLSKGPKTSIDGKPAEQKG